MIIQNTLMLMVLNGAKIGVYSNAPKIIMNLVSMMRNCLRKQLKYYVVKGATVVEDINIPSFHREWSWGVSSMN